MADVDMQELIDRSDSYQLRFNSALLGGVLMWVIGWWAMTQGYKGAAIFTAVASVAIWVYALFVWALWADVRAQIRKARSRSA